MTGHEGGGLKSAGTALPESDSGQDNSVELAVPYFEVHELAKSYALPDGTTLHAVQDVTLSMPRGRFVALLGPSGCGKSTLLKMMAGLVRPTSGSCHLDGAEVRAPSRETSLVFQEPTLLPWRSIRDNVSIGLEMRGVGRAARHRAAARYLQLAGLQGFEGSRPRELSGGMQQRAALARALCTEPSALLMDEPFGALDEQTRLMMGEELLRIWDRTRSTVVFVTHSIQEAILLADEIVLMTRRPGTVKGNFPVELPRPRSVEDVASPDGQRLYQDVWSQLRPEAVAAMEVDEVPAEARPAAFGLRRWRRGARGRGR